MVRSRGLAAATLAALGAFMACGGIASPGIEGDDAGGSTTPGKDSGSNVGDGSNNGDETSTELDSGALDSASEGGNANECDSLKAKVEELRPAAIACTIGGGQDQCSQLVHDLCCPLTVTDGNSSAVRRFSEAVKAFEDAKCNAICPKVACPNAPSKSCGGTLLQPACDQRPKAG